MRGYFVSVLVCPLQVLWNSVIASSPDNARVYRATIAPDDQKPANFNCNENLLN